MLVLASFLSQPVVFGTSISEVLMDVTLLGLLGGLYRHVECHQEGCHRLGRFKHGHLKLCHVHHPLVPDDGKITETHITAVAPDAATHHRRVEAALIALAEKHDELHVKLVHNGPQGQAEPAVEPTSTG